MKRALFLSIILFSISSIHAQKTENPFAELGYKAQTATSSKGQFEEFHDNKDIVEIGSVRYNTLTKEIVGFIDLQKTENEVSAITTAMSIDPLCEKYYWISPYAYCLNNPIRYIDPDGREVIARDDESKRNIANTLTEKEARYVKFKKDGTLNTRKLNKSKSKSDNMTALKTLANSDVKYNFVVSKQDGEGVSFYDNGNGSFYLGQTEFPNDEGAPQGKDGNVWIYTANFLSEGEQAENVAHEGYGHAFFYEKSRKDSSYDPFHRHENQPGPMEWDSEFNVPVYTMRRVDANTKLKEQIDRVTNQARVNYDKRKKK